MGKILQITTNQKYTGACRRAEQHQNGTKYRYVYKGQLKRDLKEIKNGKALGPGCSTI